MYGCESWTIKKAKCWRIDTFELQCWRRLESPLGCKEIQPVHPKGDQSWVFIGGSDVEAETPILWPPNANSWLIWKGPDAVKDWEQEKGMTGWDGWMASPTQWTWVWVDSRSWWWTGRPGVLWFMEWQRVGEDWATELTELNVPYLALFLLNNFLFKSISFMPMNKHSQIGIRFFLLTIFTFKSPAQHLI